MDLVCQICKGQHLQQFFYSPAPGEPYAIPMHTYQFKIQII